MFLRHTLSVAKEDSMDTWLALLLVFAALFIFSTGFVCGLICNAPYLPETETEPQATSSIDKAEL